MKFLWPLCVVLPLAVSCATDPNASFDAEGLSAQELKDFNSAKVILLGEQHDNPIHHEIQNDVLKTLAKQGRLKSVIFEQVDWTYQGTLDQLNKDNFDRLPKKLDWKDSGWPDYDYYKPLFQTALSARAKIIAGGLPKNRIELLYKSSYEVAFNAAEIERIKLRVPLDGVGQELLGKEIFEGHCKMIPEDHVSQMIPVQRARDAALVKGYLNEADISGVSVFIVGNGHARKEFGVPSLLRAIDPKLKIWSVGMQEVGTEALPQGAFDKVWITEKAEREDPCAQMKKHLDSKADKAAEPATAPSEEVKPAEGSALPAELPAEGDKAQDDGDDKEPNSESPASDATDTPPAEDAGE